MEKCSQFVKYTTLVTIGVLQCISSNDDETNCLKKILEQVLY